MQEEAMKEAEVEEEIKEEDAMKLNVVQPHLICTCNCCTGAA